MAPVLQQPYHLDSIFPVPILLGHGYPQPQGTVTFVHGLRSSATVIAVTWLALSPLAPRCSLSSFTVSPWMFLFFFLPSLFGTEWGFHHYSKVDKGRNQFERYHLVLQPAGNCLCLTHLSPRWARVYEGSPNYWLYLGWHAWSFRGTVECGEPAVALAARSKHGLI